jgi:hypothetical protein
MARRSDPAETRARWWAAALIAATMIGGCGESRRSTASARPTPADATLARAAPGDATMPHAASATCTRTIERLDLPARTDLILARERAGFDSMLEVLRSGGGKGGEIDDSPLTQGEVEAALRSDEPSARYAAAFLAGRCRTNASGDAALTEQLRRLLDDEATPADVAIEAAMSMVLRGEPERGHGRLRRAVASTDPSADAYKAAFFLAQLGDTSGWPAMVRTLGSNVGHYRLMAIRHLAVFLPFEGQTVDGATIDVKARLRAGLTDPDPMVRQEVPFYLEEAAVPGLRDLLAPVAKSDADPSVRTAATMVLDRLPKGR